MTQEEIRLLVEDIFSEIPIDCEKDEIADVQEEMEAIVTLHANKQVERACAWLRDRIDIEHDAINAATDDASLVLEYYEERALMAEKVANEFRKYMKGEHQ